MVTAMPLKMRGDTLLANCALGGPSGIKILGIMDSGS